MVKVQELRVLAKQMEMKDYFLLSKAELERKIKRKLPTVSRNVYTLRSLRIICKMMYLGDCWRLNKAQMIKKLEKNKIGTKTPSVRKEKEKPKPMAKKKEKPIPKKKEKPIVKNKEEPSAELKIIVIDAWIGSGKTTLCNEYGKKKGFRTIDLDTINHFLRDYGSVMDAKELFKLKFQETQKEIFKVISEAKKDHMKVLIFCGVSIWQGYDLFESIPVTKIWKDVSITEWRKRFFSGRFSLSPRELEALEDISKFMKETTFEEELVLDELKRITKRLHLTEESGVMLWNLWVTAGLARKKDPVSLFLYDRSATGISEIKRKSVTLARGFKEMHEHTLRTFLDTL